MNSKILLKGEAYHTSCISSDELMQREIIMVLSPNGYAEEDGRLL